MRFFRKKGWRSSCRSNPYVDRPALGTIKLGETIFPIVHMEFRGGLLHTTATRWGPVKGDTGICHVFDLDGNFIISNKNPTTFPDTGSYATCSVLLPISIEPNFPNPLPETWGLLND